MGRLKARMAYAIVTILLIAAGLATRQWGGYLPEFVAFHGGDAIWAAMIYSGFRFLASHKPLGGALACSMLFCFAIETSQLYQAEWIRAIRETRFGSLVLGSGFLFIDLVRYAAGILLVYGADRVIQRRAGHR
ncbi:DUF2809 domain-containing protein [Paenibacillus pinisoli]|nr:DUF2809 domain-containing protein [Paenibacillus pinisoli]